MKDFIYQVKAKIVEKGEPRFSDMHFKTLKAAKSYIAGMTRGALERYEEDNIPYEHIEYNKRGDALYGVNIFSNENNYNSFVVLNRKLF